MRKPQARITSNRIFEPIAIMTDDSYLAKYRTLNDPARPGAGERHRLLNSLRDAEFDAATTEIIAPRRNPPNPSGRPSSCAIERY